MDLTWVRSIGGIILTGACHLAYVSVTYENDLLQAYSITIKIQYLGLCIPYIYIYTYIYHAYILYEEHRPLYAIHKVEIISWRIKFRLSTKDTGAIDFIFHHNRLSVDIATTLIHRSSRRAIKCMDLMFVLALGEVFAVFITSSLWENTWQVFSLKQHWGKRRTYRRFNAMFYSCRAQARVEKCKPVWGKIFSKRIT